MKVSEQSKLLKSDTYQYAQKVCEESINRLNDIYSVLHIMAFEEDPAGKRYLATVSNTSTTFNKLLFEIQKSSEFFKTFSDNMTASLQRLATQRPKTEDRAILKDWERAKEEVLTIIYCDLFDLTQYRKYGSESTCDYNIGILRELMMEIDEEKYRWYLGELQKIICGLGELYAMVEEDLGVVEDE